MPDIGDEVTITTKVYVDGALADPSSVAITVTSPSGTDSTPTPSSDTTGIWSAVFTPDAAGRWRYTWTTTGPAGKEHGYVDVAADPPPPDRLAPLATPQDLADVLGRDLTDTELARVPALLRQASAKIRRYTGQDFDFVEDDEIVLRPVGSHLRLPQRPVTTVTSVTTNGGAGLPDILLPAGCWQWDKVDLVELWPLDSDVWLSLPDWTLYGQYGPDTYKVKYSHGYTITPDDANTVCCDVVLRTLTAPTTAAGLVQESIGGDYSYQYGQGRGQQSPGAGVKFTDDDRDALKHYRRRASTVALRVR